MGRAMAELDLLRQALTAETETSNFYKEMVSTLEGDGRRLFRRFVEIETSKAAQIFSNWRAQQVVA